MQWCCRWACAGFGFGVSVGFEVQLWVDGNLNSAASKYYRLQQGSG